MAVTLITEIKATTTAEWAQIKTKILTENLPYTLHNGQKTAERIYPATWEIDGVHIAG